MRLERGDVLPEVAAQTPGIRPLDPENVTSDRSKPESPVQVHPAMTAALWIVERIRQERDRSHTVEDTAAAASVNPGPGQSVPLRAVDQVQERYPVQVAPQILREQGAAIVVVARDEAGDVGRQDDVRDAVQRMAARRRLLGEDVDRRAGDALRGERARERLLVDAGAASHVDEVG